jgi:DNA gyrase subunit B
VTFGGSGPAGEVELVRDGFSLVATAPGREECDVNALLATKQYIRIRVLERDVAALSRPPFVIVRDQRREEFADRFSFLEALKTHGRQGWNISRYKGLGEMNAEQLWETTMDPERRTLLQVRIEDLEAAEEIFDILMGEVVESRRRFIEVNALEAENIDI